ncbi:MAG: type II toxin-antitoxin system VapC family toxin [Anaerolineae bacterium]
MTIFVDTSAFLAVIDRDDRFHPQAREVWEEWLSRGAILITSNYVVLETTALLQNRIGMKAVGLFHTDVLPVIQQEWIEPDLHHRAVAALLAARRRDLSLVDCTSFELMRHLGIRVAFTFDRHFAEQGFEVLAPEGLAEGDR